MTTILIMAPIAWLWGEGSEIPDGDLGLGADEIRVWPETGDKNDIDYILIWGQYDANFATFPNLKAVFSLGAGIDHLGDLKRFRKDIPLIRLIDPLMTQEMVGYVLLNVLRFHRLDPLYRRQQRDRDWKITFPKTNDETCIGIAGAGELSMAAARSLRELAYNVATWSRTPKSHEGIASFAGQGSLNDFLKRTDILISLLPLTEDTTEIWNRETLGQLPKGACFINAGRGGSVNEADLLHLLDEGHIEGAALDVFAREPLPDDHPFWIHDRVFITPHAASLTRISSAAEQIKANIERLRNNEPPHGLVDLDRGY